MTTLTVVGSNGTYPTPGRPASGYLISSDGRELLLDCGPGVFVALLERGRIPDIIVLSHRHGDHCLDLLPLFNHLRYGSDPRPPIPVIAPEGVFERLAAFVGAGPDHEFHRVFDHRLAEPGESLTVAGFHIRVGAAAHSVTAICVRVEVDGSSVTYSGDTGPGGDLLELATGSDLLLCEATHQGPPPEDRYPYHLHAVEVGAIAAEAGVGQLLVTHVSPTLDPDRSVAEAAASFDGPVRHASPGLETRL